MSGCIIYYVIFALAVVASVHFGWIWILSRLMAPGVVVMAIFELFPDVRVALSILVVLLCLLYRTMPVIRVLSLQPWISMIYFRGNVPVQDILPIAMVGELFQSFILMYIYGSFTSLTVGGLSGMGAADILFIQLFCFLCLATLLVSLMYNHSIWELTRLININFLLFFFSILVAKRLTTFMEAITNLFPHCFKKWK